MDGQRATRRGVLRGPRPPRHAVDRYAAGSQSLREAVREQQGGLGHGHLDGALLPARDFARQHEAVAVEARADRRAAARARADLVVHLCAGPARARRHLGTRPDTTAARGDHVAAATSQRERSDAGAVGRASILVGPRRVARLVVEEEVVDDHGSRDATDARGRDLRGEAVGHFERRGVERLVAQRRVSAPMHHQVAPQHAVLDRAPRLERGEQLRAGSQQVEHGGGREDLGGAGGDEPPVRALLL